MTDTTDRSPRGTARFTLLGPDRLPYRSAVPGTLGGHRVAKIYGRLDCPAALRAIARGGYVTNRVFFADEATALAAGFRPCGSCLPQRYQQWKAFASLAFPARTDLAGPVILDGLAGVRTGGRHWQSQSDTVVEPAMRRLDP